MISDRSLVTVCSDSAAFILVFGLIWMYRKYRLGRDKTVDSLFRTLCFSTMVNAASNAFSYAMHGQVLNWPMPLKLVPPTIAEMSSLFVLYVWMLLVEYKLYRSRERIRYLQWQFIIPLFVIGFLCLTNLFSGFLFNMDDHSYFVSGPMYLIVTLMQYVYALLPVIFVIRYYKLHGRPHFFYLAPILIPNVVAAVFTLFTDYSARSMGFGVAIMLLLFSNIDRWRYDDAESGFFNRHYMEHLDNLIRDGKRDYKGAVCFECDNCEKELFGILREELPKDAEIIRADDERFIVLTEAAKPSTLQLLASLPMDSASEYDNLNPKEKQIGLRAETVIKRSGESTPDFVKRVVYG